MTDDFDTNDLIAELQAYMGGGEREPGGVTSNEWAKARGVAPPTASNQLLQMVQAGVLTRNKYRIDGRMTFVYYKATPEALASQ